MKDEVGMAGPKSTQTRFVGIITFTIHPYACFSRSSCMLLLMSTPIQESGYFCFSVLVPSFEPFWLFAWEKFQLALLVLLLWLMRGWFIPAPGVATQKASVGMYSECDFPHKSCLCTFWSCHPYFILPILFNCFFILVTIPFLLPSGQSRQFMSFSNSIPFGMVCSFNS